MAISKKIYKIMVIAPSGIGQFFVESTYFTIGRGEGADFSVPFNGISREHLIVFSREGQIFLQDNNSTSGSRVDGQTLEPNRPIRYKQGAPIRLGTATAIFSIRLVTGIEMAQFNASGNTAFANRLIKNDLVQDAFTSIASLLNKKPNDSSGEGVSILSWEQEVEKQMRAVMADIPNLINQIQKEAKSEAEQLLQQTNIITQNMQQEAKQQISELISEAQTQAREILEKSQKLSLEYETKANEKLEKLRKKHDEKRKELEERENDKIKSIEKRGAELEEKIQQDAQRRAKELSDLAQQEYNLIIEKAQSEGRNYIAQANLAADLKNKDASEQAAGLIQQAKDQANQIIIVGKQQAEIDGVDIIKRAEAKSAEIYKTINNRKQELNELDSQIKSLSQKLNELNEQQSIIQKENKKYQLQSEELIAEVDYQKRLGKNEQEKLSKELQQKKSEFDKLNEQILLAKDQHESIKVKIQNDELKLKQLAKQVLDKTTEIDTIIKNKEEKNEGLQKSIEKSEAELIGVQNAFKSLVNKRDSLAQELAAKERSIIESAHAEKHRVLADAKLQAEKMVLDAENKVIQMQKELTHQSRVELSRAKEESAVLMEAAKTTYQKTISEADLRVETLLRNANEQANEILSKAQLDAQNQISEANKESQRINEITSNKHKVFQKEMAEKEQKILAAAQERATKTIEDAKNESKHIVSLAEAKMREISNQIENDLKLHTERDNQFKSDIERRYQEENKKIQNEYATKRLQKEEEFKHWSNEQQKIYTVQRNEQTQQIIKEIEESLPTILKTVTSISDIEKENIISIVNKSVRAVLKGEALSQQNRIKSLHDYNPEAGIKNKKYWQRSAGVAAAVIFVIAHYIINPEFYRRAMSRVGDAIVGSQEDQNKYVKMKIEEFDKMNEFVPELTTTFKDSYVDNIIYTSEYLELVQDEEYNKKRILEMHDFFYKKLHHDNSKVLADFMGAESDLIRRLLAARQRISAIGADESIKNMRAEETATKEKLKQIIGGESQFNKFWSFDKMFFENQKQQFRAPSNTNQKGN